MARGPRYRVPFRRRREGRTNYHKRLKLLLSKKPRMVVRCSNQGITIQLVTTGKDGDLTHVMARSLDLRKFGYEGYGGNTPAAYLTGLLFGKRAIDAGFDEAILDIGLATSSKGARVYAAVKGAIDAGLKVPCKEEMFPDDARIKGEVIAGYLDRYADLPRNVEEVKGAIMNGAR
ncbi:MAG TPA: 50S ribosomal protein L18 [Candidatus Syntrophoarchaeum butanivorans]|uniref:Large ribosomal subunit protein uL18 n=1 Tax=Candidatus Syntropharchaeum butanivorans TaxID=1839936 RepID=A0A1F2P5S6_9EURY|nr:MAG: 50S ribosomal protein L18 [Candidatus Syntrophoarchaeum butanivorans]HEC56321.1 50S ribosomal protein L18 [Candidatus Syntrophoarchaeum butanivorans]